MMSEDCSSSTITINALQQFSDEHISNTQSNYNSIQQQQNPGRLNSILFNFQELENITREKSHSRNQIKHSNNNNNNYNILKPRSVSTNQDQSRSKNTFSRDSVNSIENYLSNTTLNSNSIANHNKNSDIFDLLKESDTSFSKNPRLHSNTNRIPFNESQVRLNKLPSILKDSSNQMSSQKTDSLKCNQNNQNVQVKQYIMDYQVQNTSHQQNNENKYVSTLMKNRCFKNYSYSKQYQQCKQKQYYLKAVEKSAFLNQSYLNENENKPPELDISVHSITNSLNNNQNNANNCNSKKVNFISYNSYIKM